MSADDTKPGLRYLTVARVCDKLSRKKSWVYDKWARDPTFPRPVRLGKWPVFIESQIDDWVANHAAQSTRDEPPVPPAPAAPGELEQIDDQIKKVRSLLQRLYVRRNEITRVKFPCLRRGEAHGRAKLTDEQVREIRALHDQGLGYWSLARQFGVSKTLVRNICDRRYRSDV